MFAGITSHGDDSRSQHENKRLAIGRMRMNLACRVRRPINPSEEVPAFVVECIFTPRGRGKDAGRQIKVGRRDHRFWRVAAYLLDLLNAHEGRFAEAASHLGTTTGSLTSLLKSDRHLLAAVQALRQDHGQHPLH